MKQKQSSLFGSPPPIREGGPRCAKCGRDRMMCECVPGDATRSPARASDPDTSHAAAQTIDLGARQRVVLAYVRGRTQGAIASEVDEWCGTGSWKRLSELHQAGLIVQTEERRVNYKTGKSQVVWRAR